VADPPVSLAVHAVDTGHAWTVHITPDSRRVSTGAKPADLMFSGPAADLYLLLWNRSGLDGVQAEGDIAVWTLWRELAKITWS